MHRLKYRPDGISPIRLEVEKEVESFLSESQGLDSRGKEGDTWK